MAFALALPAAGPPAQEGGLTTRWASRVSAEHPHPEYPRPQLVRPRWRSLNGPWDYAIRPAGTPSMGVPQGRILVPFPLESRLGGVRKTLPRDHVLWMRRRFRAPELRPGERLWLRFGAVDWRCRVQVDGRDVGAHEGGYDAFGFDVTEALRGRDEHEIVVRIEDPTDGGFQPRGKQTRRPGGIWYTPSSGIWQTVWMEPVPPTHARAVWCVSDLANERVTVHVELSGRARRVEAAASADGAPVAVARTGPCEGVARIDLRIEEPRLWSPEDPFLYDLRVTVDAASGTDEVTSYFGMREIGLGRDERGAVRILLNGQPRFLLGVLDQGFWPDGLYTAPTDEALRFDLECAKAFGFDLIRKHVKVEPQRWYWHCDRLGLVVWQDMPSGDRAMPRGGPDLRRSEPSRRVFYRELGAMIDGLRAHPCVVAWVPFNEGWGQFDTHEVLAWVKRRDPTRLVDGPSGWNDRGAGDLRDVHAYPGPAMPPLEERRVAVLGEFGGLGLPVEGHLWTSRRSWGYRTYRDAQALRTAYASLLTGLRRLYAQGLAAAVYTQITDVESEVNGLITYDRAVQKLDAATLRALHAPFHHPPQDPVEHVLAPTAEAAPRTWRYTLEPPPPAWTRPDFDDRAWASGEAGFGTPGTPGARVRSRWDTAEIWLRRRFPVETAALHGAPHLRIHHDEDAEVWLNGKLLVRLRGYTTDYVLVPVPDLVEALEEGENVLAIHCRQTGGEQYVDAGLVEIEWRPR